MEASDISELRVMAHTRLCAPTPDEEDDEMPSLFKNSYEEGERRGPRVAVDYPQAICNGKESAVNSHQSRVTQSMHAPDIEGLCRASGAQCRVVFPCHGVPRKHLAGSTQSLPAAAPTKPECHRPGPSEGLRHVIRMKESIMNQEKLAKLQAQVRIGGKGSARRKKKVVHRTATADDKKLQFSLKKLGVNNISGIEEVNMFTNQGTVIHFNNPKVQASLAANTFTITGHAETKQLTEMLPGILNQLGADSLTSLRRLAEALPKQASDGRAPIATVEEEDEDDDVPDLVENFDEASKDEAN
ncbi:hypothetical protein F7725_015851 [Dissostichus mawsoni]|uniref:Transcription factor BTF3 n=9 Tax=Notothenioidei TaxID=8205 RepID=A0A7J5YIQ4_DISMA|nr:hypothetical protein F7725_015851 [Dissostichus mawsoni]